MNKLIILSLLTLFALAQAKVKYDILQAPDYFESFIQNYSRMYNSHEEKKYRYKIFRHNLEEINLKNRRNDSAIYKINKFSDLSKNELISKYTGLAMPNKTENFCKVITLDGPPDKGPLNFDWRNHNKVTTVKEQGPCGSCWAFATLASIESQFAIKYDTLVNLSEQQMVDCDQVDFGCEGGLLHTAFEQIIEMGGVQSERDYTYVAQRDSCKLDPGKFITRLLGCYRYIVRYEEKLKDLLRRVGPVPVAIDVSSVVDYYGGIINYCENYGLNHAVLLVGYGIENNIPYWTFKNSWGKDWGEDGYFRVRQNVNACGMVNDLISTPVVA